MRIAFVSSLVVMAALALTGCQKSAEEEFPAVEDVGVDDGSSQDLPELEKAEAAKPKPQGTTDEPTDDGGSQDDYSAAAPR